MKEFCVCPVADNDPPEWHDDDCPLALAYADPAALPSDPYVIAALKVSHPDASPSEVALRAEDLREADRFHAAEARIGGGEYRKQYNRVKIAGNGPDPTIDRYLAAAVPIMAQGRDRTTALPEAAFDWPIYVEARRHAYPLGPTTIPTLISESEQSRWSRMTAARPARSSQLRRHGRHRP